MHPIPWHDPVTSLFDSISSISSVPRMMSSSAIFSTISNPLISSDQSKRSSRFVLQVQKVRKNSADVECIRTFNLYYYVLWDIHESTLWRLSVYVWMYASVSMHCLALSAFLMLWSLLSLYVKRVLIGYRHLRMTGILWLCHGICTQAPCEWYESCDRIPILIHMTINSHTTIVEDIYVLQGNSSNQRELSAHPPPSDYGRVRSRR